MKNQKETAENNGIDPKKLWEEVQRAASQAPDWASLEAPYPVKPKHIAQAKAVPTSASERKK
jgi:hypothetical protein